MLYIERVLDESSKGEGGRSFEFRSSYGSVSIELTIPGKVANGSGIVLALPYDRTHSRDFHNLLIAG